MQVANPYDEVPYGHRVHPHTHPDRLCSVARLFGLPAPDPGRSRVLELGCASGGNLIPMAYNLPEATFLGIDLAAKQIETGVERCRETGLDNLELRPQAIEDFEPNDGPFDYIICHGLYSWVSDAARQAIFAICAHHLAEHGVAQVSFNTLPGWNLVKSVRDMMRFHTRDFDDPAEKAGQARALLEFVSEASGDEPSPYAALVRTELDLLKEVDDAYLLHDHLAEVNRPEYFHDFIDRARGQGLEYLADSDLATMLPENLPDSVAAKLREIGDIARMEQYLDYLRGRRFRNALLCRAGAPLDRELGGDALKGLRLTARFSPDSPLEERHLAPGVEVGFSVGGTRISVRDRVVKTALKILLDARPTAVSYEELIAELGRRCRLTSEQLRRALGEEANLVRLVFANALEISTMSAAFTTTVAQRPLATRLARLQAAWGSTVVNQRHESIVLGPADRVIIRGLDGNSSLEDVGRLVAEQVASGELRLKVDGEDAQSAEVADEALRLYCDGVLRGFAENALLVNADREEGTTVPVSG